MSWNIKTHQIRYYVISEVRNSLIWFLAFDNIYHSLAIVTSEAVRSCRPVDRKTTTAERNYKRKAVNRGRQMIFILQVLIWKSLPSSTETFPMKTFFPWPLVSTIPRLITKTHNISPKVSHFSKDLNMFYHCSPEWSFINGSVKIFVFQENNSLLRREHISM